MIFSEGVAVSDVTVGTTGEGVRVTVGGTGVGVTVGTKVEVSGCNGVLDSVSVELVMDDVIFPELVWDGFICVGETTFVGSNLEDEVQAVQQKVNTQNKTI